MEINIRKYNGKTNQWESIYKKEIEDNQLSQDSIQPGMRLKISK